MAEQQGVVLPAAYLPPAHYFRPLLDARLLLLNDEEPFQKQTIRSRTKILGPNKPLLLPLPLVRGKTKQQTGEVELAYAEPWQHNHWQSIRAAYGKAPFFIHYAPELEPFFEQQPSQLIDWNQQLLKAVLPLLELDVQVKLLSAATPAEKEEALKVDVLEQVEAQPHYQQVFSDRFPFVPNLSIIDLLFNLGSQAAQYLHEWR